MRAASVLGLVAVVSAAAAAGCFAKHECGTIVDDVPRRVDGELRYEPGDRRAVFVGQPDVFDVGESSLVLVAALKSGGDEQRAVRLAFRGLRAGATQTLPGDATGEACLVLQSDAEPTCLPLAGTVVVRALALDCFHHESGVSVCAEDVDVSIDAAPSSADAADLSLPIALAVTEHQHWNDPGCYP